MLSLLTRIFRSGEKALSPSGGGGYLLPLGGGFIPSGWPVNFWQCGYDPLQSGRSAVVYACKQAYAQTIAMCPASHWRSTGNGGRERVTTSALSRILRTPNFYQSPSDFFLYLTDCLYGQGEAFGLGIRNDRFEISEIHLMDPRSCAARVDEGGALNYSLGGNPIVDRLFATNPGKLSQYPARDVLHVRLPDPRNPLKGIPPLEAAMTEIAASNAMVAQALTYSMNQGRPSGVLEAPAATKLDKEQVDYLRAEWNRQTQGDNIGGTPILTNGLKWSQTVVTSRDAQLAELLQVSDSRIATAYRVPPPLLSLFNGGAQGPQASTESLMQFWTATGMGFAANHIEESFGQLFRLVGQPDEYMELDFTALLRASFRDRIEGLARGVISGIYSPNEARAEESLPRKAFGDEPRVQQQVVPLSAWADAPPATPAPPAPAAPPSAPPPGDSNANAGRDWARIISDHADRLDRVA